MRCLERAASMYFPKWSFWWKNIRLFQKFLFSMVFSYISGNFRHTILRKYVLILGVENFLFYLILVHKNIPLLNALETSLLDFSLNVLFTLILLINFQILVSNRIRWNNIASVYFAENQWPYLFEFTSWDLVSKESKKFAFKINTYSGYEKNNRSTLFAFYF